MNELSLKDLLTVGAETGLAKSFFQGTHRSQYPADLLAALSSELPRFGISRVARLTGLDRIGIEVYTVVRPNSYGLSVTQGKGIGRDAAKLSGIMEAIECWHAERPENALFLSSASDLISRFPNAPVHHWQADIDPGQRILWTFATHLVSGDDMPVPFDLVHSNFESSSRTYASGLLATTNGLASGGNMAEAVTHALCETIERHATALFGAQSSEARAKHALDLTSVDDPQCRALIDKCDHAEVGLKVWDATCDIAVPCFIACLSDERDGQMPPGFGAGCHPARGVALARAITEAAQSRLTRISGARDDLAPKFYGKLERTRARFLVEQRDRSQVLIFTDIVDCASMCLVEDYRRVITRLLDAGHSDVFAVTLADDFRYSVVRVIVPSLQGLEGET